MSTESREPLREAFEKWATGEGYPIEREGDDSEGAERVYCDPRVHAAYWAWCAALSTQTANPLTEGEDREPVAEATKLFAFDFRSPPPDGWMHQLVLVKDGATVPPGTRLYAHREAQDAARLTDALTNIRAACFVNEGEDAEEALARVRRYVAAIEHTIQEKR